MPTFTITKDGQTLDTVTLEGERIELGSANTCKLFIDDLLISLHQAAFLKTPAGYDIEPIARTPQFTMNGEKISERTPIAPGAVIAVEGYEIRVDTGARAASAGSAAASKPAAPPPPEPLPPLPPIEEPKPAATAAPKPLPPLPPLEPLEPGPPKPAPPKEASLPPLPPPLPPIPEPLFAEDAPPKAPAQALSSEPPPLPPLPPLEAPPSSKSKPSAEAKTQYAAPVKPIGQLVVTKGPLKGRSWPIAGIEIKIGREQGQNDILVRFDAKGEIDTSISRRHASILIDGDYAFVQDQGSVAGTFVNGKQAAKGERVPLRSGDEIEIRSAKESTVFRVELGTPELRPAPAPPLPEPSYTPPPLSPAPAPHLEPPPEPSRQESRREEREPRREREPIRRRERRGGFDEDNPFAPVQPQGMPQWVWFAIGGAVIVIVLILVFVFI